MDWIDPPADRREAARRSAKLLLLGAVMVAAASLMSSLIPRQSSASGGSAPMPSRASPPAPAKPEPALPETIAAPLKDEAGRPLLGSLRTATHCLWFYAGENEPLVTICNARGKVLQAGVPQSEVYQLFPELQLEQLQDTPDTRQLMHAEPAAAPPGE
ncbi:MAG: hypothetical protein ACKVS8_07905 [Phycisphaerales bacterium]